MIEAMKQKIAIGHNLGFVSLWVAACWFDGHWFESSDLGCELVFVHSLG